MANIGEKAKLRKIAKNWRKLQFFNTFTVHFNRKRTFFTGDIGGSCGLTLGSHVGTRRQLRAEGQRTDAHTET